MKFGCAAVFIVLCVIVMCDGRARLPGHVTSPEIRISDISDRETMEDREQEDRGTGESLEILVAKELLSALDEAFGGSYAKNIATDPGSLAGGTLRIGLFAFMGYHGQDGCMERSACEAGDLLGRMSDTSTLALTAIHYMAPSQWSNLVRVVKKGANGSSCVVYKCETSQRSFSNNEL